MHRSEELLGKAQQPHSCLLEDIQQRDHEVVGERQKCLQLEGEITALKEERTAMMETRNQMASDLERLLSHREVRKDVMYARKGSVSPPLCLFVGTSSHQTSAVGIVEQTTVIIITGSG